MTFLGKRLTPAVVVLACAAGLTQVPTPSSASDPDAPSVRVRLVVLDADSTRLDNRMFSVNVVEDLSNGDQVSRPATYARTDNTGTLDASFDEEAMPATDEAKLEIVLLGKRGEQGFVYMLDGRREGDRWVVSLADGTTVSTETSDARTGRLKVGKGQIDTRRMTATAAEADGGMAVPSGEDSTSSPDDTPETIDPPSDAPTGSSTTSCPHPYVLYWSAKNDYKTRYVPNKWAQTRNHATLTWSMSRTHETKLQVAFNASGSKYAGGLEGFVSNTSSITQKPTFANNVRQVWKIGVKMRKYRGGCLYTTPDMAEPEYYSLDLTKWRPYSKDDGYSQKVDTAATVECGGHTAEFRGPFGAETTVARGSTARYANWFSIIGVSLDSSSTDSTAQSFTITPDAGEADPWLCGNNASPLYATFVKEIPKP